MAWTTPKTDFAPGNVLTAAQMNAIGNNLDALYDRTGLVLVSPTTVSGTGVSITGNGTVTFTSATVVNINGCFTSEFDQYRLMLSYTGSASGATTLRVRAAGTDLTTSTYKWISPYWQAIVGGGPGVDQSNSDTSINFAFSGAVRSLATYDVADPFQAQNTVFTGLQVDNRATLVGTTRWSVVNNTTSYDGFSLTPPSGNITGTIRIYGYSK